MRILFFILLSFACKAQYSCSVPVLLPSNYIPVIIVSGQSNAVGQIADKGSGYAATPNYLKYTQPNILVNWEGNYLTYDTNTLDFLPMQVPTTTYYYQYTNPASAGYDVGNWSVEQVAARKLQELFNRQIYVIRSAKGATEINAWVNSDSSQWIRLNRYIRHAISDIEAQGKVPYFVSMAWLQGESNVLMWHVRGYVDSMRTIITKVRQISPYTANLQFVMFKLSLSGNVPTAYRDTVNNAFITLAAENPTLNKIIETSGEPQYNTLHYSSDALLSLGDKWFRVLNVGLISYTKNFIR